MHFWGKLHKDTRPAILMGTYLVHAKLMLQRSQVKHVPLTPPQNLLRCPFYGRMVS